MSDELYDVQVARWRGFEVLAEKLPQHQILAMEMFRTLDDETIAIITVSRDGRPFRYAVRGDSRGRVNVDDCHLHAKDPIRAQAQQFLRAALAAPDDSGGGVANFSLGHPPPTDPGQPGIVELGAASLTQNFGLGEQTDIDS